ncbi:hypothetical protein SDJN03_04555, partial [Cucurbita argyrosperma subsp. sororia]
MVMEMEIERTHIESLRILGEAHVVGSWRVEVGVREWKEGTEKERELLRGMMIMKLHKLVTPAEVAEHSC